MNNKQVKGFKYQIKLFSKSIYIKKTMAYNLKLSIKLKRRNNGYYYQL